MQTADGYRRHDIAVGEEMFPSGKKTSIFSLSLSFSSSWLSSQAKAHNSLTLWVNPLTLGERERANGRGGAAGWVFRVTIYFCKLGGDTIL